MDCLDNRGRNPLPRLIAFLPSVATVVLDRCISRHGDPEDENYSITYDFKYIDIDPDSNTCRRGKVWYTNVRTISTLHLPYVCVCAM